MTALAAGTCGPSSPMRVEHFDSISSIRPELWDSLLGPGDLLASHEFIRICEELQAPNGAVRHAMVFDTDGPAAFASFFLLTVPLDLLSTGLTRLAVSFVRGMFPGVLRVPVVLCGPPVSFGSSCLRVRGDADAVRATDLIITSLEGFAREHGIGLVCVKELDAGLQEQAGPSLRSAGFFPVESLPGCRLDIRWKSYDEYQTCLRSGYRRQVALDRRAAARDGQTVTAGPGLLPDAGTAHRLYRNVIERARFRMEVLPREFFDLLESRAGSKLHGIAVQRGGRTVANAVLLGRAPVCYFLLVGLDYENMLAGHAYQNIVACTIRSAIDVGASVLEMGQTSYDMKSRLGARSTPRHIWLKHRSRAMHRLLAAAAPVLFPRVLPPIRNVFREGPGDPV